MRLDRALSYDYTVAKYFMFATILFGIVGMGIGVLIAFQMAYPDLNYLAGEYGTFSRLRPLHTAGVIFGFMLSGVFATWYYIGQRVLKVSMSESPFLMTVGKLHFWIYMLVMAGGVFSLLAGVSTSKEYAELEWPLDIGVVVLWVLWGVSIFGLIGIRRERTLYISVWYFIATFLGIAM
ncbi:cbb3-type cytochrome c oxidase subunit I, partial [Campylobacter showae]